MWIGVLIFLMVAIGSFVAVFQESIRDMIESYREMKAADDDR